LADGDETVGFHVVVDLMASDPQVAQFVAHAKMFRMRRVRLQIGDILEFGDKHDIAGMVDIADIDTDLDVLQAMK
jgi:hypothetical protein